MFTKVCRWCKKEFETNIPNKWYCSDKHKLEARRETKRKSQQKIRDNDISLPLGTTILKGKPVIGTKVYYLGAPIPFSEFMNECRAVRNAKNEIVSTLIGRKKNNIWVEYGTYGKIDHGAPTSTSQYRLNSDFNLSVNYWMETTQKCPECEDTEHLRDVSRAEIACSCGLTLAGPMHRSVKYPDENYPDIPIAKYSHEHKLSKLKIEMEFINSDSPSNPQEG